MLSDSYRAGKIIIIGVLILAACLFNYYYARIERRAFFRKIDNPEQYAGQVLAFSYARVAGVEKDSLDVIHKDRVFSIYAPDHNVPRYKAVSFNVRLHADGRLEMLDRHVHYRQRAKLYVSILAMCAVLYLVSRRYRFEWISFQFRERSER